MRLSLFVLSSLRQFKVAGIKQTRDISFTATQALAGQPTTDGGCKSTGNQTYQLSNRDSPLDCQSRSVIIAQRESCFADTMHVPSMHRPHANCSCKICASDLSAFQSRFSTRFVRTPCVIMTADRRGSPHQHGLAPWSTSDVSSKEKAPSTTSWDQLGVVTYSTSPIHPERSHLMSCGRPACKYPEPLKHLRSLPDPMRCTRRTCRGRCWNEAWRSKRDGISVSQFRMLGRSSQGL